MTTTTTATVRLRGAADDQGILTHELFAAAGISAAQFGGWLASAFDREDVMPGEARTA
ncbi:hypothetical protein [Frondihabitans sp. PAMC 28766]|uniref:hypothetical protein n=1 Tax=Frondihabitans sp. PAMC 28766 TaxID=1795630 RepID=UPI0012FF992E|nr:hypothetical protein [Frondihabitans sp. PAMC 28766]